ncbi:MAG: hypothetical protein RL303_487 [Verrucomicrobiota bacterium]|jgi:preprotein translocase SecE subunit
MFSLLGKLRAFWNETINEVFVKATWPTAKELTDSTLVVIAAVALLGGVVFLCDFSLSNFVQYATKLVR